MLKAYIIGPHLGATIKDTERNQDKAVEVAAELWEIGVAAFCPQANVASMLGPDTTGLEKYRKFVAGHMMWLAEADFVVSIEGWREDSMSCLQMRFAMKFLKQVFHMENRDTIGDIEKWARERE